MGGTSSSLTITPATLNITAAAETKVYGTAEPVLAYSVSGFEFSEIAGTVLTGHLARAAGETVSGSPCAITQGTLTANSNYTIHFAGSSLSITGARRPWHQRSRRGLHRLADRVPGDGDRRQRRGGREPGRYHADPDVLRRNEHLGHGSGLDGAFRRRDVHRRGSVRRQRRLRCSSVAASFLRDRSGRRDDQAGIFEQLTRVRAGR